MLEDQGFPIPSTASPRADARYAGQVRFKRKRDPGRREVDDGAREGVVGGVERLPVPFDVDLQGPVSALWRSKINHCLTDTYAGIPLSKLPEDLRTYEHLIWLADVEVVVELGTHSGGAALWFRDRLRTLADHGRIAAPRVIAADLEIERASTLLGRVCPHFEEEITLLAGDVTDPSLAERIRGMVPDGSSCLVIDDSAHTHATTIAALRYYSDLVQPGGFFVVEDGCEDIDEMRAIDWWPRGVIPAIREWLASDQGAPFESRRDLEMYGLTCHPEGYLQRRF
jgi:cephalosporin hydroxylase